MARYDIIVIGAGVAGLTAAATAARRGAGVLVIDRLGVGGQVASVDQIENFPGLGEAVSGLDLGLTLQEQAESLDAELMLADVSSVRARPDGIDVTCGGETLSCSALIIAAGSSRRKLEVPGETALIGRGVSNCASCDGPIFRGKPVVVVGGGDSAFDEALLLSQLATTVTMVYRGAAPRAQAAAVERIDACKNVVQRAGSTVSRVMGEAQVTGVEITHLETGETELLLAEALFVYIGLEPNTAFLDGLLALDGAGRIRVDSALRASEPRIFAAGDIRSGSPAILSSAAGDGAVASVEAVRILSAKQLLASSRDPG